jgi:hypothetical protein
VRAFPAQDQPGTRRPTCEVDQSGGLGDPRTVAGFDDRTPLAGTWLGYLVGGCPGLLGELGQDPVDVELVQVGAHRELHPHRRQVMGERVRGTGGVGAHQHRAPTLLIRRAPRRRELRQRGIEDLDVIGCGVGACVARTQQRGQHDLPRIMDRPRPPPGPQPSRQLPAQPGGASRRHQQ